MKENFSVSPRLIGDVSDKTIIKQRGVDNKSRRLKTQKQAICRGSISSNDKNGNKSSLQT